MGSVHIIVFWLMNIQIVVKLFAVNSNWIRFRVRSAAREDGQYTAEVSASSSSSETAEPKVSPSPSFVLSNSIMPTDSSESSWL